MTLNAAAQLQHAFDRQERKKERAARSSWGDWCGKGSTATIRPGRRAGSAPAKGAEQTSAAKTISVAHFGDDASLLSQTSNRSAPYLWDRIAAGTVRVAIGGHELPFTTTRTRPVFASDISGAEWTVTPELRTGAVVLALTAPDSCKQREPGTGRIRSAVAATAPRSMPGCRTSGDTAPSRARVPVLGVPQIRPSAVHSFHRAAFPVALLFRRHHAELTPDLRLLIEVLLERGIAARIAVDNRHVAERLAVGSDLGRIVSGVHQVVQAPDRSAERAAIYVETRTTLARDNVGYDLG